MSPSPTFSVIITIILRHYCHVFPSHMRITVVVFNPVIHHDRHRCHRWPLSASSCLTTSVARSASNRFMLTWFLFHSKNSPSCPPCVTMRWSSSRPIACKMGMMSRWKWTMPLKKWNYRHTSEAKMVRHGENEHCGSQFRVRRGTTDGWITSNFWCAILAWWLSQSLTNLFNVSRCLHGECFL